MKKMLVVDDEISIFNIIKAIVKGLMQNDFIIDYASNGEKGLLLFKKNNYDLILTDFNMPSMNGIELIRKIKKIDNKIPVFLMTGNENVVRKDINIIHKPFDIETIGKIIRVP